MSETQKFPDFPIAKVMIMFDDMVPESERRILRNTYLNSAGAKEITGNLHNSITGKAIACVRQVVMNGGTKNEVHRCFQYLAVCIDAKKHHLDYKKAYDDLLIGYLLEKYGAVRSKKD